MKQVPPTGPLAYVDIERIDLLDEAISQSLIPMVQNGGTSNKYILIRLEKESRKNGT